MIGSAIREFAAARRVPLIAAAFFQGHVQIWDVAAHRMQGEFPISFQAGSGSLVMHPDGTSIIAGLSRRRGSIASHATPLGAVLWSRDSVEECSFFDFDSSGNVVSFSLGRRSMVERADAHSGTTVHVLQDTGRYFAGRKDDQALLTGRSRRDYLIIQGDNKVSIPKLTFAILGVAFSPRTACITESGGPVRCVECESGKELWRHTPPNDSHILDLHYNALDGFFYGVVWHYQRGEFRYLVRFDSETGQSIRVRDLNSWVEVFIEATEQLITSSGEIIDLASGKAVGELCFPKKEYPDPLNVA